MFNKLISRFRPPQAASLATVYLREGRMLVQASDRTDSRHAGFWVATPPVVSLDAAAGAATVGQAVLDALARSRVEAPVPDRGVDLEAPLRNAAGVRSRRALMMGTRACWVNREEGEIRIDPLRNGGASGPERGFSPLPLSERCTLEATATAETVGRAVIAALERATIPSDAQSG
jgi:hypothetical protein